MPDWIANHFVNPAIAWSWAAAAIVAAPILIHLINRLRYRRVRFAAMEFLLASQQRNRRRILIEQLLLLLVRVAAVILIILLVGRFVADASVLDVFQEARAHHVVLLDDSGSMRDQIGGASAFDEARETIERIAAQGARQTGTQKFTLLLLSRPEETVTGLSERVIDTRLQADLTTFLEDVECTVQRLSLAEGIESAKGRLLDDRSSERFLHLLSDFRQVDWLEDTALPAAIRELDAAGVRVNLIRTVAESHENLAVTDLSGEVQAAASGVPVRYETRIANTGQRPASNVRMVVAVDGNRLPFTVEVDTIPPGAEVVRDFVTAIDEPGRHALSVSLEPDALDQDNSRSLALDVPRQIPVLIIDGTPEQSQGQYIVDVLADSLGEGRVLTGLDPTLQTPDYLRKFPLDRFQSIVLINVPQLPEDGVVALERYVAGGGGLAWYVGNLTQSDFYNDRLFNEGRGIFPVRLQKTAALLPHDLSAAAPVPDVIPQNDHPLLAMLDQPELNLLQYITINAWLPVDTDWWTSGEERDESLRVIANLRNNSPLILEHRYGTDGGRIVTFLTAAGPLELPARPGETVSTWNNWAVGPGAAGTFAIVQIESQKLIGRTDRLPESKTVGEPIVRTFDPGLYRADIEITSPDNRVTQLKALPVEQEPDAEGTSPAGGAEAASGETAGGLLRSVFAETHQPGVYEVRMTRQDGTDVTSLVAVNVPVAESRLTLATDSELLRELGNVENVEIRSVGADQWLVTDDAGNEMRIPMIVALLALLILEQFLSYRFSYHPQTSPAPVVASRTA